MKRCNYWFLTVGALLILTLTACDVNIASEVLSSSATDRTIHVTPGVVQLLVNQILQRSM